MNSKRSIIITCVSCLLVMAAVFGIIYWQLRGQEQEPVQPAGSCGELTLYLHFSSGTEEVDIWQDQEGVYYFFLPAGAGNAKISFGNLGSGDTVSLDGRSFGRKDDIGEFIEGLSQEQILELELKAGEETEAVQVRFMRSANLAAMYIDTSSGSVESIHADKTVKEAAAMRLVDEEGNICYSGNLEYIRTRGNTSWNNDKKPYQFKLEKEASFLGMPSAKRWILLANYVDDTMMKNELVYRYAERFSTVPTINGQYVDLYVNGSYMGNYYLCEKIEVGRNRLDITDLEEATEKVNPENRYGNASPYVSEDGRIRAFQGLVNPADITGGYILEHLADEKWDETDNGFLTASGQPYAIVSPCPATVEQAEYICGLMDEMEAAIADESGINPVTGKHFSEYLDVDSWASKYVMEEVFHDPDAMIGASMYLYKDSDSVDPLIYSGPMWDYDRAWGDYGYYVYHIDNARQIVKCGLYVDELMKFDEVSALVYEKFQKEMVPYVESIAKTDIYELNQYISASVDMNMVRWPDSHGYYTEREANVDYLSWFLEEKVDYLKDVWLGEDNYCTVTFLDYNGNVCDTYQVKQGECFTETPTVTAYVAVFAGWYVQGENIPYIPGLPVLTDVTYESRWVDINLILQNGLNDLDMDLSQVDPETLENMAEVLREMQKADQGDDIQVSEPSDKEE